MYLSSQEKISKEKFLEVYNKHLPNKWTTFIYRYFSRTTKKEDKWLSRSVYGILIVLFFLGFIGTILKVYHTFIGIVTFTFTGILILLVGSTLPALIMNNLRIRKIRKELNLSLNEYEFYVDIYFS